MCNEECSICLEPLHHATCKCPNGHSFHRACMIKWMKQSLQCPLCRIRLDVSIRLSSDFRIVINNSFCVFGKDWPIVSIPITNIIRVHKTKKSIILDSRLQSGAVSLEIKMAPEKCPGVYRALERVLCGS